jgi:hypothetical protein
MKKLALAVMLSALAPACEKVCTLVGCGDSATLSLRRADGARPDFALELEIDGRRVTCASAEQTCDMGVTTTVRPLADCHEERGADFRRLVCTPNGRFEQVISLGGTPARVSVTVKSPNGATAQQTFALVYQTTQPNGPGCEPICKQASESWEIP